MGSDEYDWQIRRDGLSKQSTSSIKRSESKIRADGYDWQIRRDGFSKQRTTSINKRFDQKLESD
jgi:hypothetical protein